jgi:hypothetical protein
VGPDTRNVIASPAEQRPSWLPTVVYGLVTLISVAAGGFIFWYRAYYNVWPGQDATARVHWCERDYQNDGPPAETWRQVTAENRGPVRALGRYPPLGWPGQELFAALFTDPQPSSCATVIYVRTGPGKYQAYSLLGGP